MRRLPAALPALLVVLLAPAAARGQAGPEALGAALPAVLPAADSFSAREGDPPVFRGYRVGAVGSGPTHLRSSFPPPHMPPEQMGFDGPISVLVGMDLDGRLTGVRVLDYRESLRRSRGDFLSAPAFLAHFAGKRITDAFQVKRDVEGITGATISVDAMARGVRSAARRVALAHGLGAGPVVAESPAWDPLDATAAELEPLSWSGIVEAGLASRIQVVEAGRVQAELVLMPLRDTVSAGVVLGPGLLAEVRARAGAPLGERRLLVVGVDGPLAGGLNLGRLSVVQGGDTIPTPGDGVLLFGPPREGKLDGQVRFLRVLLFGGDVDLSRPLRFVLDLRPGLDVYAAQWPAATTVAAASPAAADADAAAAAEPAADPLEEQITRELLAFEDEGEVTWLARTLATTSWPRLGALALLLSLATAAFVTKREALRWAALVGTLGFLGFADRSFLSISHVSAAMRVGPDLFLSDLRLLLLVGFTVVTTLLVGRVFCGYLCPFGALQDLLDRWVPRPWKREMSQRAHDRARWIKYGVLAVVLTPALVGSGVSLFQWFEPFGTVFFLSPSPLLWMVALGLLGASALVPRFYCRYVCPLGAALALGSLLAPFRIRRVEQCTVCKVCEQRCPTRAIRNERIDFEECVRCGVCEVKLARKAGVCRHDMEGVRSRLVQVEVGRR